jgi:ABC-type polysaccharide/polyol phosphate transport system ATPase subunit
VLEEHTRTGTDPLDVARAPLSDAPPAIVVDNVSKRFRLYRERANSLKERLTARRRLRSKFADFWALRDISVTIPKGTTYGFIGHNGSGKSTLLRLMAGIHPPTSGTVETHGRISALLELGAGFHPELSGRENVYLNGSILGLTRREVNAVIDQIIDFAGLEDFIDSPVKHYSSGMYVRLGFAVAVHVKPDILMIDEVIAVGDEEFQRRCFEHLYQLKRDGVTIVLVSHSAPLMEQMCDRLVWLDHGKLMAEGDPPAVVRKYLDKVNVAENERLATTGETEAVAPDPRRWGSREIEILGVDYLDSSGARLTSASTGDRLVVRIRYRARDAITDPVFALGFYNEAGVNVAGPNTGFAGVATGVVRGEGHVDYVIPRLSLMPGGWRVSVAVWDQSMMHTYDQWEKVFELRVQPGSSVERFGLADLQGQWEISSRRS